MIPSAVSKKTKARQAYVALLRGINVGGKNIVPMKDLAAMFTDVGCGDVRTYIQSGNVIFTADAKAVSKVPQVVSKRILSRFDIEAPVIVRSAQELERMASRNPFLRRGADAAALHVAFLAECPTAEAACSLDPRRSPGDSFEIVSREIYLHLPNGMARSKLTNAYFDSKLRTVSTVRNWRTVLKLVELSREN